MLAQAHHCDCIAPAVCIAYEAEWRQRINMNICAHSAALRAEPCRERGASSIHAVKLTFVMHIACALDRGTEDGMVLFVEKRGSLSVVGRLKKKGGSSMVLCVLSLMYRCGARKAGAEARTLVVVVVVVGKNANDARYRWVGWPVAGCMFPIPDPTQANTPNHTQPHTNTCRCPFCGVHIRCCTSGRSWHVWHREEGITEASYLRGRLIDCHLSFLRWRATTYYYCVCGPHVPSDDA